MFENGFVHLSKEAAWLAEYVHELSALPKGKHDDQAGSTARMLDWFKQAGSGPSSGDTDQFYSGVGTFVNRGAVVVGNATHAAAKEVRAKNSANRRRTFRMRRGGPRAGGRAGHVPRGAALNIAQSVVSGPRTGARRL